MRTYILASHGKLAEGILSSAEMIIGKQENVKVFCLKPGEHPQNFAEDIKEMIAQDPNRDYIIITDIVGGSVYTALSQLIKCERVYIVSGMNLSMVLELFLISETSSIQEGIREVLEKSKKSIVFTNDLVKQNYEEGGKEEWLNC
ncbi:PTS sugar transporter subunit IIA [Haloimpatiens sp. FM7330]|uniref:PTS sugar transporter subunit IIA n=1 Tax=Haloimpatiens sp. FM7330 TaxID=3298610 RepID=UPI00362A7657